MALDGSASARREAGHGLLVRGCSARGLRRHLRHLNPGQNAVTWLCVPNLHASNEWKLPWISNDVFLFKRLELRHHFKEWIMILGDFFLHGCSELPGNCLLKLLQLLSLMEVSHSLNCLGNTGCSISSSSLYSIFAFPWIYKEKANQQWTAQLEQE